MGKIEHFCKNLRGDDHFSLCLYILTVGLRHVWTVTQVLSGVNREKCSIFVQPLELNLKVCTNGCSDRKRLSSQWFDSSPAG